MVLDLQPKWPGQPSAGDWLRAHPVAPSAAWVKLVEDIARMREADGAWVKLVVRALEPSRITDARFERLVQSLAYELEASRALFGIGSLIGDFLILRLAGYDPNLKTDALRRRIAGLKKIGLTDPAARDALKALAKRQKTTKRTLLVNEFLPTALFLAVTKCDTKPRRVGKDWITRGGQRVRISTEDLPLDLWVRVVLAEMYHEAARLVLEEARPVPEVVDAIRDEPVELSPLEWVMTREEVSRRRSALPKLLTRHEKELLALIAEHPGLSRAAQARKLKRSKTALQKTKIRLIKKVTSL